MSLYGSLASDFASSPIPGPDGTPNPAWDLTVQVPDGNVCNANDGWLWITLPNNGMWINWLALLNPMQVLSIPLTTRAATYAQFGLY